VRGDHVATGVVGLRDIHPHDLGVEVAAVAGRNGACLGKGRPLVLRLAADLAPLGHVLGRHPHRDVDVVAGAVRSFEPRVRHGERHAGAPRGGLDPGGDVLVALSGLDRVKRHPDRLQRRRAEAVDGDARDVVVETGQQRCVAGDVVALLVIGKPAAHHHVDGL